MIGKTISHYRILEKLGEGGMGVVYKVRDSHLDRFVALKILPAEKVADPDRKRRFVQEAKAASSLNHPHIVTIHDIDEADGVHFIAMEYVEGKTLDQLIPRHGMRLNEALKVAVPIADALAAAHEAGIVHRDLKPGNLIVTDKGQVKVLDFGLAKLTEKVLPGAQDATLTAKLGTEENQIVGTVAYMSPEQAEGKKVDARSDIFSFGSVLYEMLTGQRPFQGDSKLSIMTAILREDPKPAAQIVKNLPQEVERIIARCLRKDQSRRFQHMGDVKMELEELKEESDSGKLLAAPGLQRAPHWNLLWAGILLALLAIAAVALWFNYRRPEAPEQPSTVVPLTSYAGNESQPSFSPDGNQVAFCWNGEGQDNYDIYQKLIGSEPPRRLTTDPADDTSPAWSPDGRSIVFLRSLSLEKAAVLLISVLSGPERQLAEVYTIPFSPALHFASASAPAWSPDGKWLVLADKNSPEEPIGLFVLSIETGEKRRLTSPPVKSIGDTDPAFSPDGRTLAFIRTAAFASGDVHLLSLSDGLEAVGEVKRLTFDNLWGSRPAWTLNGREIIYPSGPAERTLWRIAVSGPGKAQQLLASFGEDDDHPALSRQGQRLAYTRQFSDSNIWRVQLAGLEGKVSPPVRLIGSTQLEFMPMFSPDGKRIAFSSRRTGHDEIWVGDSDGSHAVKLTSFNGPLTGAPCWSPDGQRLAFASVAEGQFKVFVISASGGKPRRLTADPAGENPSSWSRDGRWIYFGSNRVGKDYQIWKMPTQGGTPVQVTRKGGFIALESPDGKVLYYVKSDGPTSLWKVPVEGGEENQVLASLSHGANFAVVDEGIYFIPTPDPTAGYSIQFFSFATRKITLITKIGRPVELGLSVSPDRKWILYSQIDQQSSDLMLVENFR
jgi:Tol biopolymer transport system component/predicted Ser/Thr protein kinase